MLKQVALTVATALGQHSVYTVAVPSAGFITAENQTSKTHRIFHLEIIGWLQTLRGQQTTRTPLGHKVDAAASRLDINKTPITQ
jgi:hypothetical protein